MDQKRTIGYDYVARQWIGRDLSARGDFLGCADAPRVWSVITAYFDESGTHDGSRVTAFAGFTATDPEWSSFSIQWRMCLERHGIHGPFHMSEFENRKGEFSDLTDKDRLSLITSLSDIIRKHDTAGLAVCIDTKRFNRLVASKDLHGKAAEPYYLLMQVAMAYTVLGNAVIRPNERLLFIFERKPKFVQLSNLAFDSMLEVHPWVKGMVSNQIIFASKESHAALQAADMLAYEAYKRALDPERKERKLYSALKSTFDKIVQFDDETLRSFNFDSVLADIRARRSSSTNRVI